MKRLMVCAALLSALALSPVTRAEAAAAPQSTPNEEAPALSPVAAAISAIPAVCGTFNKDAERFVYLYSASWCGPCRQVMPSIVQLYKDKLSKEKRVEIILIGFDRTPEEAKKYAEHYNAGFLTIMGRTPAVDNLPGAIQVRGIPYCIVVDKNGKRIFNGHAGALMRNSDALK